jgi:hypothetical protein
VDWIKMASDKIQWRSAVKIVNIFWFLKDLIFGAAVQVPLSER